MIIHGDCLDEMKKMADNSISGIVTDPPYGLSFMGKGWDHAVPGIEYWRECYRVLKPGGHLLAMGGTRTFHRQTCAIEDSGFEIRDCLMWLYGSGFPKSHNNFGFDGYGTALKPAYEPITLSMKPLDGTFKQNAEKWGQAGINIDGCRIPTTDKYSYPNGAGGNGFHGGVGREPDGTRTEDVRSSPKGRWPANVIFDEEAAKMLDEQSGESKSPSLTSRGKRQSNYGMGVQFDIPCHNDSGGSSRFFYCAKTSSKERNEGLEGLPDKVGGGMCSTVSGDTRSGHITIQKNNHPTVKPLKLMRYLITLIMPPKDGILLDPFAGSGSTIIAAHQLGVKAIGIEKQKEYVEIANKRLEYYMNTKEEKDLDLFSTAV
jgi:site-specific DNA-methyltransferase (adenine-specific)